jgi:hypothetical protein
MLKYEIRERNIDLENKKQNKKKLLKWIVFCEAVNSKFTTSFSL